MLNTSSMTTDDQLQSKIYLPYMSWKDESSEPCTSIFFFYRLFIKDCIILSFTIYKKAIEYALAVEISKCNIAFGKRVIIIIHYNTNMHCINTVQGVNNNYHTKTYDCITCTAASIYQVILGHEDDIIIIMTLL